MPKPMSPEHWHEVKELFRAAAELPGGDRERFLASGCRDRAVIGEVMSLLGHDPESPDYNDQTLLDALGASAADAVTEEAEAGVLLPGARLGPYRILGELGQGGMACVYLAERDDEQYRQRVALKVVKRGMDTQAVLDRFRHERQILANLVHPNIARLLDGGTTPDGMPYFVMECVEGEPLNAFCASRAMELTQRLHLFITVCGAVDYAHRNMVVHRDLKPGNILVTAEGVPMLLDFGIAKLLTPGAVSDATAAWGRMLTPRYASPEQVRGELVSTATDVYSLGVLLFQLLTGALPYSPEGENPEETARVICAVVPEKPSSVMSLGEKHRKRLRGDLDNIVLMALRKEPERRYRSVAHLQADLICHLEGSPVAARQDTLTYRTGRFLRRNKLAAVASLLVTAALVGGMITTTWQARRADEQRRLALRRQGDAERAGALFREAAAVAVSAQLRAEQDHAEALRQSNLAQRRLTDMLELANTSLFAVDGEIAKLNGAETVRAKVAANTLDYLTRLGRQAGDDPRVMQVLSNAYIRLGDVQGSVMMPSLGDTDAALVSYRESERLAARIYAVQPGVVNLIAWWQVADRLANVLNQARGRQAEALGIYRATVAAMETFAARKPFRELTVQIAVAHDRVGDILTANRPQEAIPHFLREIALMESLVSGVAPPDMMAVLGQGYSGIGRAYRNLNQLPRAEVAFGQSARIWEQVVERLPNESRWGRFLPVAYSDLGNLRYHAYLPNTGDWHASLEAYRRIIPLLEAGVAAAPANATAQRDLATVLMSTGCRAMAPEMAQERLGDLERARSMASELILKDPRATNYRRLMANTLVCLGDHWRRTGNTSLAEAAYREGLDASALAGSADSNPALSTNSSLRNGLVAVLAAEGRGEEAAAMARAAIEETARVMRASPEQDVPQLLHVRAWLALAEARPRGNAACDAWQNARSVWDAAGAEKNHSWPLDEERVARDGELCRAR